jgi:hypothetical protein
MAFDVRTRFYSHNNITQSVHEVPICLRDRIRAENNKNKYTNAVKCVRKAADRSVLQIDAGVVAINAPMPLFAFFWFQ